MFVNFVKMIFFRKEIRNNVETVVVVVEKGDLVVDVGGFGVVLELLLFLELSDLLNFDY